MSNIVAQGLLEKAIDLEEVGKLDDAIATYHKAIQADEQWSTPHYNLGLIYKYKNEWQLSFDHNKKAIVFDPENEAAWWNLGIAATALLNWRTAREAWNYFGWNLDVNDDEIRLNIGDAPIRLNPDGEAEVVWCERIDPARAIIYNIPLPSSRHRFGDMVLNDGAAVGYRTGSNGEDIPVFNELQLLTPSSYITYSVNAYINVQQDIEKLNELCESAKIEFENWSTIKFLCKQCSEGTPHESHDHDLQVEPSNEKRFGFASISMDAVLQVLKEWRVITLCEHDELKLELG